MLLTPQNTFNKESIISYINYHKNKLSTKL